MRKEILIGYILWTLFTIFGILKKNFEFLIYSATIIALLLLIHKADKHIKFSNLALNCFNVWLLMHIIGGFGSIGGIRMYDYMLIDLIGEPYNIFKYDQLVHYFCYVAMGLLMHDVVSKYVKKGTHAFALSLLAVLGACGIGATNEFIEFLAVAFLDSNGVGGYFNTALDIVFNTFGAITSAIIWHFRK